MPRFFNHRSHKNNKKSLEYKLLSKLIIVVAVVEPFITLPQAYNVWLKHEWVGVSMATWLFFSITAFIWLLYGLMLKNAPLIISNALWVILDGSIVVGLIVH